MVQLENRTKHTINTYYLITWVFEELIVLQLNVVLVTKIAFFSGLYQLSVSVNVCVCTLHVHNCSLSFILPLQGKA